jgi:hypothetical protein
MHTNLLDLKNDVLNIIGGYVKRDNERRIDQEDSFEVTDFYIKHLKETTNLVNVKGPKNMCGCAIAMSTPCAHRVHTVHQGFR